MADKTDKSGTTPKHKSRLAEALRVNLQRRKAQARSRKGGTAAASAGKNPPRSEGNGPENAE